MMYGLNMKDDIPGREKNLISLAVEAGLQPEPFKAAMLAEKKWHSSEDNPEWSDAHFPGAVIEGIKAYLANLWQPMSSAPEDGRHCILAIKRGGFIYSIQGAYMRGKWMNAADSEGEPLAWMPNILLPDALCPWSDEYKALHSTDKVTHE